MVLFYLGGYLIILARVDRDRVVDGFTYFHFGFSIISPIAQLLRATMLSLNLFGVLCSHLPAGGLAHPSGMETYGGPILYLVIQSVLLFSFLVWQDYGFSLGNWRRIPNPVCRDEEDSKTREKEVIEEEERVVSSTDGLRVLHLSKVYRSGMFGKLHAVDDLSFGVKHGEVFGLLGPNGGGFCPFAVSSLYSKLLKANSMQLENRQQYPCFVGISNHQRLLLSSCSTVHPSCIIAQQHAKTSACARNMMPST